MDIIINIAWDDEAKVYTAMCPEIGLFLESDSYDRLKERIIVCVPEMAEENSVDLKTVLLRSEQSLAVSA